MKLFFSWQSDLPDEKKFIRKCLQEICDSLDIEYDEDTRDTGSAEFVTDILLRKIKNSAVFVADLTPVGLSNQKKLANPNVCFELGFAESHLGREQLIITYNEDLATFDDLPFDLSKRNSVRFKLSASDQQKEIYKKQLKKAVVSALRHINKASREILSGEKPLNKYEKTLLFWGIAQGGGLISEAWHKDEDSVRTLDGKALSIGDNRLWYESDTFFYNRYDSRQTALFESALKTLVDRGYATPVGDGKPRMLTEGMAWAITEEGEVIAKTLSENEVLPLVTITKKSS